MELIEKLLHGFGEVWPAVNHAPVAFSLLTIAIFLLGFAIAGLYYWREVRVLRALGAMLEQRIKIHEHDSAMLAALLRPETWEAFSAIHRAPNHKLDVPHPPAQVAALSEYRLLLDLGMIGIEKTAANRTSLSSTSAGTKLWDRVVR